jgi:preprotein translocase subunit SecD
MKTKSTWKNWLIPGLIIMALIYLAPSLLRPLPAWWPSFLPEDKIHLGLDLQGGMHLILGVKVDKAVESAVAQLVSDIKQDLRKAHIPYNSIETVATDGLEIKLPSEDLQDKLDEVLEEYSQLEATVIETAPQLWVRLKLTKAERRRVEEFAVSQGLETIRNRVDEFGVSEPTIQRQGENRILIQLPGIKDSNRAIKLIGKTAMLEFKLVDEENSVEQALKGQIPPGDEILYEREVDPRTGQVKKIPYLVKKKTLMTGDVITEARIGFDQMNQPMVLMSFDKRGTRLFARITEANIKRKLAIVLDGTVYSAPVIQDKIPSGRAQITGRFTEEEAHDLAVVLRAGALPAPVEILEQRSVGPSLGHDSIEQGIRSILVGGLVVLLFMMVYYKLSGVVANLALILNLVFLLSALAALRATLTLPGIAGIVLTIGMAVDANVLIFERIREELALGKTVRAAVDGGYSKAFLTILDANITTLIAALVLFQFGTGPIKGFAVTLSLGILASMFTAIVVTRVVFDLALKNRRVKKLSI